MGCSPFIKELICNFPHYTDFPPLWEELKIKYLKSEDVYSVCLTSGRSAPEAGISRRRFQRGGGEGGRLAGSILCPPPHAHIGFTWCAL